MNSISGIVMEGIDDMCHIQYHVQVESLNFLCHAYLGYSVNISDLYHTSSLSKNSCFVPSITSLKIRIWLTCRFPNRKEARLP